MKRGYDIQHILQYIDERPNERITVDELAELSAYSFYRFCHAFSSYTGVPVATYLRRRQLALAARDLLDGVSSTDVAAARGFDTSSGFAKAFRRQYGMSPTEFRRELGDDRFRVSPSFRKLEAFTAIGYRLAPPKRDFDVLDAHVYWADKDFSFVSREDYRRLAGEDAQEIGAWIQPDRETGAFFYFFGPIVQDTSFVPEGLELLRVEASEYAVFPVPPGNGNMTLLNQNVRRMWKYIFAEWLPENGTYQAADGKIDFECYHQGTTSIYLPVVPIP